MTILKPKTIETKTLSFRLPASVIAEFEAVRAQADELGLVFELTEHVERAIASTVRLVRTELAAHVKQSAAVARHVA